MTAVTVEPVTIEGIDTDGDVQCAVIDCEAPAVWRIVWRPLPCGHAHPCPVCTDHKRKLTATFPPVLVHCGATDWLASRYIADVVAL